MRRERQPSCCLGKLQAANKSLRTRRLGHFDSRDKRMLKVHGVVICAIALAAGARQVAAAEAAVPKLPLSVPVKTLAPPTSESQEATQGPATPRSPQRGPTLPGGKLPQYQLGHRQRALPSAEQLQDAKLRFVLALPAQPILVQVSITIDGQPFRMAREKRIQQVLESISPTARGAEPAGNSDPASNTQEGDTDQRVGERDATAEPIVPPDAPASSVIERVRRYIAATGTEPTREEIRWLLTNWSDGPTLLLLNNNFQRFRADQRPLFDVLDRNRDERVSADELQHAVRSLNECDFDRNEIVDYAEIAQVADDPRRKLAKHAGPDVLMVPLRDITSAPAIYERLAAHYASDPGEPGSPGANVVPRFDKNGDGRFDTEEQEQLRAAEADVTLALAFETTMPDKSSIAVTALAGDLDEVLEAPFVQPSAITLALAGTNVTFSAVQAGASDQIAVGAVNDGYPILPAVDPNEDGRFTIREMRGLAESLRALDRNQDGRLTSDEAQAPVRICFSLGPHVHRELAAIRSLNPAPKTPLAAGPEWFVRMDRNKDNDLTRREFPGTDEQFTRLDADSDQLISAREAVHYDKQSRTPDNKPAPPKPEPSAAPSEKTE